MSERRAGRSPRSIVLGLAAFAMAMGFLESAAWAQQSAEAAQASEAGYALDNAMLFLAAVLVLFMQAGFAMVEVGLNAAKNTVNILFKNLMDVSLGVLIFFVVGFALMYPANYPGHADGNGFLDFGGFGLYPSSAEQTFSPYADWFFQAAFAATAATIVSGAVAGRMQFRAYLIYTAVITGLVYPISGYWKWGGGWLTRFANDMAFQDFAGSAVVHAVGGFAGLAGAIVLGPRIGRYVNGRSMPMPGHNLAFATLGVFVLWVGWYGFNPGSQLAFQSRSDIDAVLFIAVNTTLAAGAGGVAATLASWLVFRKPDLSMSLNGVLGGLVGITACCDAMSNGWSMVVGGVAGVLVLLGVVFLDKLRIDDPVGAWPVHGLCGVWGCLALGLLPNAHLESGATNLTIQVVGTLAIAGWSLVTMLGLFSAMRLMGILRVSPQQELEGLDISEHGMKAYAPDAYPLPAVSAGAAREADPLEKMATAGA